MYKKIRLLFSPYPFGGTDLSPGFSRADPDTVYPGDFPKNKIPVFSAWCRVTLRQPGLLWVNYFV